MIKFFVKKKEKVYDKWALFILATVVVAVGISTEFLKETSAVELDVDKQREALLEVAHAYFRQGVQNQYDSYRKNLYSTPEDATDQHYTYTVCSGFVFQSYYQAFGIEIPYYTEQMLDYAKQNKNNKELVPIYYDGVDKIYSKDVLGTAEVSNYLNLSREWSKWLLPGDVIIVTGHAFMVDSIDYDNNIVYTIEAINGGRYHLETHEDRFDKNGTIDYRKLSKKMSGYYNLIVNDTSNDEISQLAVIRFINEDAGYMNIKGETKTYKISDSAKSRVKYPDIDIEKTMKVTNGKVSINKNVMVDLDNTITYEISIKNNSGYEGNPFITENNKKKVAYGAFDVIENVDSRLEIVDVGDGVVSGNKIKWSFSGLAAGDTIKISYTVKVPNDETLLNKTIVSTGLVDNIHNSRIEIYIGNRLDEEEQNKLKASYNKLKNNSSIERNFINDVYLDAFNLDLGLNNELTNFDIMSYDSSVSAGGNDILSVKTTKINDTSISKYIYSNFYGLRTDVANVPDKNVVRSTNQWNVFTINEFNDRARTLTYDMLIDGDIILGYLGDSKPDDTKLVNKAYIYMNGKLIGKKSSSKFEELSHDELTIFLRNIIGDNYVILRPSIMMYQKNTGNGTDISFTKDIVLKKDENYVRFLNQKTTVSKFLSMIDVSSNISKRIVSNDKVQKNDDDLVVTGDIVAFYNGDNKFEEYLIAVIGDSNGDGRVSLLDLSELRKHVAGTIDDKTNKIFKKEGIYFHAIDINDSGKVSLIDLSSVRKMIVGDDIDEKN